MNNAIDYIDIEVSFNNNRSFPSSSLVDIFPFLWIGFIAEAGGALPNGALLSSFVLITS